MAVTAGCFMIVNETTKKQQRIRSEPIPEQLRASVGLWMCWECRQGHHDHCDALNMQFCLCRWQEGHEPDLYDDSEDEVF